MTFTDVAAGDGFTIALDSHGRVWSWGDNMYWNWLVQTNQLPGEETAGLLRYHGDVLKKDINPVNGKLGRPSASGDTWLDPLPGLVMTEEGVPLGTGTITISTADTISVKLENQPDPIISIAAGKDFAMALSRSGRVYIWGANTFGQLGQGEDFNELSLSVARPVVKGASPSSIGSILSDVAEIAAGDATAYAIRSNGDLWSWGSNCSAYSNEAGEVQYTLTGQLGAGVQDLKRDAPVRVGRGMSPQNADKVEYMNRVVSVAAGSGHAIVLRADSNDENNGGIYGFGRNDKGQIATQVSAATFSEVPVRLLYSGGTHVAAGGDSSLAQAPYPTVGGAVTLLAWGDNSRGQLGTGVTEVVEITDPDTGESHMTTVNVNGAGTPVNGAGTANPTGSANMEIGWSISMGGDHMAFSINNGDVYAAGANGMGQLGDFTEKDSNVPVRVGQEGFSSLELHGYLSALGTSTGH